MLRGKLIDDYWCVIKLGYNFRLWKLMPMTVIGMRTDAKYRPTVEMYDCNKLI